MEWTETSDSEEVFERTMADDDMRERQIEQIKLEKTNGTEMRSLGMVIGMCQLLLGEEVGETPWLIYTRGGILANQPFWHSQINGLSPFLRE